MAQDWPGSISALRNATAGNFHHFSLVCIMYKVL